MSFGDFFRRNIVEVDDLLLDAHTVAEYHPCYVSEQTLLHPETRESLGVFYRVCRGWNYITEKRFMYEDDAVEFMNEWVDENVPPWERG